jgi:uncharacterized membrane protein
MHPLKRASNIEKLLYAVATFGVVLMIASAWGGNVLFVVGLVIFAVAAILLNPFGWLY